jgi:hypothetical protein
VTCLASEQMTYSYDQDTSVTRSWFVAGFADGTVKTFDERAPAGHGLNAREHSQWVVSCSLRKGVGASKQPVDVCLFAEDPTITVLACGIFFRRMYGGRHRQRGRRREVLGFENHELVQDD